MGRRNGVLEFVENDNGCFITTSHVLNKDGHCYICRNYKQVRAHRHIYEECFGEIPKGLVVRHKCDVRNCINPEHLELGTNRENTHDTINRGRKALGERSHRNSITEEKAREIKIMLRDGKRNCEIIRALDVTSKIVYSIRSGRTWNHVDISA